MTDSLLNDTGDDQPNLDPTKNYLEELVGEGKKFKTVEDLAKGKWVSDSYIPILERQKDEMRQDLLRLRNEYNAGPKIQELIDQYESLNKSNREPPITSNDDNVKPGLKPEEIESLVSDKIKQFDLQKKQQDNFNIVQTKLKERFGRDYPSILKEQIEVLGLTDEDINALARKSPTAFFKTIGLDTEAPAKETFQTPPKSTQRTDNFSPKSNKRTWAFYQQMKKDNPTLYRDPKTSVQMHNDAIALGDEFKDGDYNAF